MHLKMYVDFALEEDGEGTYLFAEGSITEI